MILDFGSYIINESSLKKLKREVHGVLNMAARKKMRKELRSNIITFKFQKRNGEIRTAHGTLHPDYLPKLRGGAPRPEHQMVYYDLDKEGWRSFRSFKFIKILNIKPVEGPPPKPAPKPISKPVSKPKHEPEEEEEVKKPIHSEEEEKVEKKPVHKEKEEKVEKKPIHKEKEEPESILDDKETEEEKEVIKKDKEKEKEEKEEKEEKKKDKDEDKEKDKDEKKKTNESVNPVEEYPNVTTLGDGEYDGALWGHCFVYEGQKYYSECGWKNIFPSYCKMVVEDGKAWAHQVDEYQRESLKKLYQ